MKYDPKDKFVYQKGDLVTGTSEEMAALKKKLDAERDESLKQRRTEQKNSTASGDNIGILDLLELKGFDRAQRCKFVRHQQEGIDLEDYLRRRWLESYQAFQRKPIFDKAEYIVSFIGFRRTQARFLGVYRVLDCKPGDEGYLPPDFPEKYSIEWKTPDYFFYQLSKEQGYDELENRVVIEWGKGTRSWVQWARDDKEVVEVLARGSLRKPFDDYLGFTLTHSELTELFAQPMANREWHARLRAVAGVYLILDTLTGSQYVGSAYGTEGFWGRWEQYANNGHGGNKMLIDLVAKNPGAYPGVFSYSILQVLPSSSTDKEVIRWETLYKEKLGTLAHGLNL